MPKDQFGTKIYPGNRVVLNAPQGMISGIVTQIDEGKISLTDSTGAKQRPGHIVVMCDLHIMFDPNADPTIGALAVTMAQRDDSRDAFEVPPKLPV